MSEGISTSEVFSHFDTYRVTQTEFLRQGIVDQTSHTSFPKASSSRMLVSVCSDDLSDQGLDREEALIVQRANNDRLGIDQGVTQDHTGQKRVHSILGSKLAVYDTSSGVVCIHISVGDCEPFPV